VGNPDAAKLSDTWSVWSSGFAWRERAVAYDDHLAKLRRDAYEKAMRTRRRVRLVRRRRSEAA